MQFSPGVIKWTVSVISSNPPCNDGNAWFSTVPYIKRCLIKYVLDERREAHSNKHMLMQIKVSIFHISWSVNGHCNFCMECQLKLRLVPLINAGLFVLHVSGCNVDASQNYQNIRLDIIQNTNICICTSFFNA